MKDCRKLAGKRNFCPFHATPLCHVDCPPLQRREPGGAGQHDVGRLVKGSAHHCVTDPADATVQIRFAGLVLLRCQPEVRTDGLRFCKPRWVVHCRAICDRNERANARRGHKSLADPILGADPFGPRFNIVILRDSHQSGYNLGRAGPLRHLVCRAKQAVVSLSHEIDYLQKHLRTGVNFFVDFGIVVATKH